MDMSVRLKEPPQGRPFEARPLHIPRALAEKIVAELVNFMPKSAWLFALKIEAHCYCDPIEPAQILIAYNETDKRWETNPPPDPKEQS